MTSEDRGVETSSRAAMLISVCRGLPEERVDRTGDASIPFAPPHPRRPRTMTGEYTHAPPSPTPELSATQEPEGYRQPAGILYEVRERERTEMHHDFGFHAKSNLDVVCSLLCDGIRIKHTHVTSPPSTHASYFMRSLKQGP